jgi:hypothetical protein
MELKLFYMICRVHSHEICVLTFDYAHPELEHEIECDLLRMEVWSAYVIYFAYVNATCAVVLLW